MKGCRSESGAVDSVEGSTGVLDTSFWSTRRLENVSQTNAKLEDGSTWRDGAGPRVGPGWRVEGWEVSECTRVHSASKNWEERGRKDWEKWKGRGSEFWNSQSACKLLKGWKLVTSSKLQLLSTSCSTELLSAAFFIPQISYRIQGCVARILPQLLELNRDMQEVQSAL